MGRVGSGEEEKFSLPDPDPKGPINFYWGYLLDRSKIQKWVGLGLMREERHFLLPGPGPKGTIKWFCSCAGLVEGGAFPLPGPDPKGPINCYWGCVLGRSKLQKNGSGWIRWGGETFFPLPGPAPKGPINLYWGWVLGRVGLGERNKNFLPTGSRPKESNKIILQLCWVRRGGERPTYPVPTQKVQQTFIEVEFWVGSKMQENG